MSYEAQYLTKDEAAGYLRVSVRTLDSIIAKGDIAGARIGGRRLLFRKQDLDGYVERRLEEATR